jgi:hypothetical protein
VDIHTGSGLVYVAKICTLNWLYKPLNWLYKLLKNLQFFVCFVSVGLGWVGLVWFGWVGGCWLVLFGG